MSGHLTPNTEEKFNKLDQRDKLFRGFEVLVLAILVGLTLFSLIRLNQVADNNKKNIDEHRMQIEENNTAAEVQLKLAASINRAKLDTGLCIFSVSPTKRTPEYVKSCYDLIEKQTGIKDLQRFGDGVQ